MIVATKALLAYQNKDIFAQDVQLAARLILRNAPGSLRKRENGDAHIAAAWFRWHTGPREQLYAFSMPIPLLYRPPTVLHDRYFRITAPFRGRTAAVIGDDDRLHFSLLFSSSRRLLASIATRFGPHDDDMVISL